MSAFATAALNVAASTQMLAKTQRRIAARHTKRRTFRQPCRSQKDGDKVLFFSRVVPNSLTSANPREVRADDRACG
jgi:hypothetical protein